MWWHNLCRWIFIKFISTLQRIILLLILYIEDNLPNEKHDLNRKKVERLFGTEILNIMDSVKKLIEDMKWLLQASPATNRDDQLLQSIYDILQNSYDNININNELNWQNNRPINDNNNSINNNLISILSYNCNGFKRTMSSVKVMINEYDMVHLTEHMLYEWREYYLKSIIEPHHKLISIPAKFSMKHFRPIKVTALIYNSNKVKIKESHLLTHCIIHVTIEILFFFHRASAFRLLKSFIE